jgi:hypothetical protein
VGTQPHQLHQRRGLPQGIHLEFVKNGRKELAPLFDNGVSFFAPLTDRRPEIEAFDVLSNNITNSDFGTRYLEDNLALIEGGTLCLPMPDEPQLRSALFDAFGEDEGFPVWLRDRVLDMIMRRMRRAQELLDNR